MADRQGIVLVSDDLLASFSGKFNVIGIYTGDIIIFAEPSHVIQLVVLFVIECSLDDPFRSIILEVSLPGEPEPRHMSVPLVSPPQSRPGRTRWILRLPFALNNILLRPGQIRTKVIHEKGEMDLGGPWVILAQELAPNAPTFRAS
jgi:hypothetical protein